MIELKQIPVIVHELQKVGKSVTERLEALNIEGQVATLETVKSLKDLRAELNKELKTYEAQRKAVKDGINKPYNEFESVYNAEISDKYTKAVSTLKSKIATVEDEVKAKKKQDLKDYFEELCEVEGIDFFKFERLGLSVNLSTSLKKYKEEINAAVLKVKDELNLIDTHEFKAEVLVEYKESMNVAQAIQKVQNRKQKEAEEKERILKQKYLARSRKLESIGMKADPDTRSYVYNDSIYVAWDNIKDVSGEEFTKRVIGFEEEIKADIEAKRKPEPAPSAVETPAPKPTPKPEVLKAPSAVETPAPKPTPKPEPEKKAEQLKACFEVTGTMKELMSLKSFLVENNINYKNI